MAVVDSKWQSTFPISGMKHNTPKSIIEYLFRRHEPNDIVLLSNGDLQVKSKIIDLVDEQSLVMGNVNEARFIKYTRARITNKLIHNLLALLAFLFSCFFLVNSAYLVGFLFRGIELSILQQLSIFVSPFIIIIFDHIRLTFTLESSLEVIYEGKENIRFNGIAPDSSLFTLAKVFLVFGTFIPAFLFLEWVIEQAPLVGDLFGYISGLLLIWIFCVGFYNLFFKPESINPEDFDDFALGYQHMYIAMMMTRNKEIFSGQKSPTVAKEIDEIIKELIEYKDQLGSLSSFNETISTSNPSMGVLAIGISCEIMMRDACESIGINFSPSARPTLDPLIKQYNREKGIDSKIKSYLEMIKEMRNRAAHDFNIDWNEFRMVAKQFCDVIKWYTEQLETSSIPKTIHHPSNE